MLYALPQHLGDLQDSPATTNIKEERWKAERARYFAAQARHEGLYRSLDGLGMCIPTCLISSWADVHTKALFYMYERTVDGTISIVVPFYDEIKS
jgi:hypothetical protein